ncbi:MAG: DUF4870 domain-containing protein [Stackebrandtia sp.]
MSSPQDQYPGYPQQPPGYGYSVPPMTGPPPPSGGPPTPQECKDASVAHYLGLLGIIGSLIYLAVAGNRSAFVRANTVAVLNFNISIAIYNLILTIVWVVMIVASIGFGTPVMAMIVSIVWIPAIFGMVIWLLVACLQGASAAKRGQVYPYRGSFKLVKN